MYINIRKMVGLSKFRQNWIFRQGLQNFARAFKISPFLAFWRKFRQSGNAVDHPGQSSSFHPYSVWPDLWPQVDFENRALPLSISQLVLKLLMTFSGFSSPFFVVPRDSPRESLPSTRFVTQPRAKKQTKFAERKESKDLKEEENLEKKEPSGQAQPEPARGGSNPDFSSLNRIESYSNRVEPNRTQNFRTRTEPNPSQKKYIPTLTAERSQIWKIILFEKNLISP